jgi:NTP pyrophosphatase (non-canonical NTP hydrolase)
MDWTSKEQNRMDYVAQRLGFPQSMFNFTLGIMQDAGELATEIAKKEGVKKLKATDDVSNLDEKIASELADILVWVYQIGSHYNIDVAQGFHNKLDILEKRIYK